MDSKSIAKQLCHLDEDSCAIIIGGIRSKEFENGYSRGYEAKNRDSVNRKHYRSKQTLKRWGAFLDMLRNEVSDRYKLA